MARLRGNSWQADAIIDGRRVRRSFKLESEALAFEQFKVLPEVNLKVLVPLSQRMRDAAHMLWGRTPNSRNAIRITEEIISFNSDDEPWTTPMVRDFMTLQLTKGLTHGTINRKLACLSKLLKYLDDGDTMTIVMPKIRYLKEREGRIRYLTRQEEELIFSHLPNKYWLLYAFLVDTGARFSEALRLQWKDVEPDRVIFWETKGGGARTIPLTMRLRGPSLYNQAGDHGPFSLIDYDAAHAAWTKAVVASGLSHDDQVVPHVLRHTCCSRLVQAGIDLRRVMTWMGHSDIRTTLRYAHLAPNDLDIAVQVLERGAQPGGV